MYMFAFVCFCVLCSTDTVGINWDKLGGTPINPPPWTTNSRREALPVVPLRPPLRPRTALWCKEGITATNVKLLGPTKTTWNLGEQSTKIPGWKMGEKCSINMYKHVKIHRLDPVFGAFESSMLWVNPAISMVKLPFGLNSQGSGPCWRWVVWTCWVIRHLGDLAESVCFCSPPSQAA